MSPFIPIARWQRPGSDADYELCRVVAKSPRYQIEPVPTRNTFVLIHYKPRYRIIGGGGRFHPTVQTDPADPKGAHPMPDRFELGVLASALLEVLDSDGVGTYGTSHHSIRDSLEPKALRRLSDYLEVDSKIVFSEEALTGPETRTEARKAYQHAAARSLGQLRIGPLSLMHLLVSSPALNRNPPTIDVFVFTRQEIASQSYFVVLILGFDPLPLWSVKLARKGNRWNELDLRDERAVVLAESREGPVHALVEAGLLIDESVDRQQAWMDMRLEGIPAPEILFDVEAYRLLGNALPWTWDTESFIEWARASASGD